MNCFGEYEQRDAKKNSITITFTSKCVKIRNKHKQL